MSENIRVVLADDNPLIRMGIRALLSTEESIDLIGEAADGLEAERLIQDLTPALAKEFNAASRRDLQRGLAPQAPETASVGRREKFELDHIVPLKRGGSVYDLDNIQIMSPKNHVEKSRNE